MIGWTSHLSGHSPELQGAGLPHSLEAGVPDKNQPNRMGKGYFGSVSRFEATFIWLYGLGLSWCSPSWWKLTEEAAHPWGLGSTFVTGGTGVPNPLQVTRPYLLEAAPPFFTSIPQPGTVFGPSAFRDISDPACCNRRMPCRVSGSQICHLPAQEGLRHRCAGC